MTKHAPPSEGGESSDNHRPPPKDGTETMEHGHHEGMQEQSHQNVPVGASDTTGGSLSPAPFVQDTKGGRRRRKSTRKPKRKSKAAKKSRKTARKSARKSRRRRRR